MTGNVSGFKPSKLDEFVAKDNVKNLINITILASKKQNIELPHMLISGPPGCGKTTLVNIITNEYGNGSKLYKMVGGSVKNDTMLIKTILSMNDGDMLFIDEIHNLQDKYFEAIYDVMTDCIMSVKTGNTSQVFNTNKITIIGATTNVGALEKPAIDRFKVKVNITLYTPSELAEIIRINQRVKTTVEARLAIANLSRGTPRIAIGYIDNITNYAIAMDKDLIDNDVVEEALNTIGIDKYGLGDVQREILRLLGNTFVGESVGIKTISNMIGRSENEITMLYEPDLINNEFIIRTRSGRSITNKGMIYLKEFMNA